jgi:hypothetical protein
MAIEETKKFAKPSKLPFYFVLVCLFAVYLLGSIQLYKLLITRDVSNVLRAIGEFITNNFGIIALTILLLIIFSIIFVYVILKFASKYGKQLTIFVGLAFPIIIIIFVVVLMVLAPASIPALIFFLLFPIVFLIIALLKYERLKLAGELVSMSASVILAEKEILLLSFLSGLFIFVTMIFDLLMVSYLWDILIYENEITAYIVAFLAFLASAWVIYSISFYFDGAIIAIVDDWYRNPDKDVANIRKGLKRAFDFLGPIVLLGFIFAILSAIERLSRLAQMRIRARGGGAAIILLILLIIRLIVSLFRAIFEFITFFTLPSIIIEQKGLKEGIKRSARLVWNHFIDVLLAYTAVNWAYGLLVLISFVLFGVAGFATGYFFLYYFLPFDRFIAALIMLLIFLVIGFIPTYIMIRPLYTVYRTLLLEYAIDRENKFTLPSRLPEHLKVKFEDIIRREGPRSKRIFAKPP